MRKATLCCLVVVCVSLLLGVTAPFAQRPEEGAAKASSSTITSGTELLLVSEGLLPVTSEGCIPPSQCCKICSKGKACGDSCIRREYTCHKPRGCACNQEEVCEN